MLPDNFNELIRAESEKLGFCVCGFTGAEPPEDFARYMQWLESDPVGTMGYLKREDTLAKRADPRVLLPGAQSICVLGVQMAIRPPTENPEVASYAHYVDYHEAILPMAEALVGHIQEYLQTFRFDKGFRIQDQEVIYPDFQPRSPDHLPQTTDLRYRICIDSAPILERSLAVRAGLGWIGKSSMFINPRYGSGLFLCEILLNLPIPPDPPYIRDGCGNCRRCADACPNRCIDPQTRTIRADQCASYLTIEHKGEFSPEQIELVGTHLFGCDECLRACPWNSRNTGESPLQPAPCIPQISDYELTDAEFKEKFKNTPVLRTKAKGLRRNIEAVRKNSGR